MEIEKNIPITKRKGGEKKYPWDKMEIGDSFFSAGDTSYNQRLMACNAAGYAKRHGSSMKFATRREAGGVRIWRIA